MDGENIGCPYSDEELDYWDGVSNPMGPACNGCDNLDCEHNPNPGPDEGWSDDSSDIDLTDIDPEE